MYLDLKTLPATPRLLRLFYFSHTYLTYIGKFNNYNLTTLLTQFEHCFIEHIKKTHANLARLNVL